MRKIAPVPNVDEVLTTAEVAELLGLSVSTVNRLADAGKLRTARKFPGLRGARLYNRVDVEAIKEAS